MKGFLVQELTFIIIIQYYPPLPDLSFSGHNIHNGGIVVHHSTTKLIDYIQQSILGTSST
jgi:hypothetical protein